MGESVERYDEAPQVRLFEDGNVAWRGVSPRLAVVRQVEHAIVHVPLVVLAVVASVLWSRWAWIAVAVLLALAVWDVAMAGLRVRRISWAELPDELVIRRGWWFRSLVAVPYGRLQYVDLDSGPVMRRFGLASLSMNTASPASGGSLPGLELADAESLRERLMERGEAERSGL